MGYYTSHRLSVSGDVDKNFDYEAAIGEFCDYGGSTFEESIKWYNCNKDMKAFSKLHPNVIFTVHGEGEESGDLWEAHFKDGKMQHCEGVITYEEYSEDKLV